ncbi:alpha/beta hydrolase [Sphingobacterium sp. N143]|uniref:alpha/beta fold hydrolase n=1 Tax=Sphingobacterium sp. N143 TaxID=2746727 RepID=UPI002574FD09|nr:alpha/beta hydrolase [Sphingobacterium sp. N143]MDM1296489.1 alpha/beta hydrolase [Sphingobacterium sp. N143]
MSSMASIFSVIFGALFFFSSAYGQSTEMDLHKKYERDKARFLAFESKHRGVVEAVNHRISYLKWGDSKDKVLIWLPGSFLSAYDFYPFAEQLVKDGYTVLSVDHYGHGLTHIPERDLDFWDFADDLAAVMDSLHIQKAVLGGFSRGGYLATAFYDKHPQRVSGLVLEDGGTVAFRSLFDQMGPAGRHDFLRSVTPPPEVQKLLFDRYGSEFEIYKNIDQLDGSAGQWQIFGFIRHVGDDWLLYHGLNEYMNMQDSLHYVQVLNNAPDISKYASSMVRVDPLKTYSSLHVPMLIMDAVGKQDTFGSEEGNRKLKAMHPDLIQHKIIDCADHNIHFACPQDFMAELQRFLDSL